MVEQASLFSICSGSGRDSPAMNICFFEGDKS